MWHTLKFYRFLMIKFIQSAFPYKSRWSKWQFMKFMAWNGRTASPKFTFWGACPLHSPATPMNIIFLTETREKIMVRIRVRAWIRLGIGLNHPPAVVDLRLALFWHIFEVNGSSSVNRIEGITCLLKTLDTNVEKWTWWYGCYKICSLWIVLYYSGGQKLGLFTTLKKLIQ